MDARLLQTALSVESVLITVETVLEPPHEPAYVDRHYRLSGTPMAGTYIRWSDYVYHTGSTSSKAHGDDKQLNWDWIADFHIDAVRVAPRCVELFSSFTEQGLSGEELASAVENQLLEEYSQQICLMCGEKLFVHVLGLDDTDCDGFYR